MLRELLIVLGLILLNGVFAGAEIALLSVRKARILELSAKGNERARAIEALRKNPERFLATVQIGITVVGATAAAFAGETSAERMAAFLRIAGLGEEAAEDLSLAAVVAVISFLSLVLGELVPKSLALRSAEAYALAVGRPLYWLSRLATPLVWILTASSNLVLKIFKDETSFVESRLTAEELRQMIEDAARAGELDRATTEMATRVFDFRELRIDAVMVPRPAIIVLRHDAPRADIESTLARTTFSRLPITGDGVDNIVGYVRARDVYAQLARGEAVDLHALKHPVPFVAETMRALDVLRHLQRKQQPLAIVTDEQGGVSGLVTVEDLVEEIVGEILNEGEKTEPLIHKEPDGSTLISGLTPIHEINRALGLDLQPGRGFSTVGGFIVSVSGQLPQQGSTVQTPDGAEFLVEQVSTRRVLSVRLIRRPSPT
ncbi:hemolysin family protein [Pendulispora brunnea]|uniref:Hemolysin family protein n=1 Tax=Pendulispora brunnea TaxID=2905690 RepID=A0ABZ2JU84_9BACT